jgi:glycosyltransferase involved in cell wall biosynthesis
MRYAWDLNQTYFPNPLVRLAAAPLLGYLRWWDRKSSGRVHHFIANSGNVRARIRRCYGRDSEVIHPPVDTSRFGPAARPEPYSLIVSALVPYKRIDLAVEAFNRLGAPLVIVGDGPEGHRLRRLARRNVTFLGWQPDDRLPELYARAAAFILPGVEDFGIAAVEAQAAGRPVIAAGEGGAKETVLPGRTGEFFWPQTVAALTDAFRSMDFSRYRPSEIQTHAGQFDRSVFEGKMSRKISEILAHRPDRRKKAT